MDDKQFEAIKAQLDKVLDSSHANVGIRFGFTLYSEFRRRGLFDYKLADFILWAWTMPSYRDHFASEGPETADDGYLIGVPRA
jgi:hypothetical protein